MQTHLSLHLISNVSAHWALFNICFSKPSFYLLWFQQT